MAKKKSKFSWPHEDLDEIACAVYKDRMGHVSKQNREGYEGIDSDFFSSIDKALKKIKSEEDKLEKSQGNFKDSVLALPFIFIMNLVVGATRTYLKWDLEKKNVPIGISENQFNAQVFAENDLLRNFLKNFTSLVISSPKSSFFKLYFLLAFWIAKIKFFFNAAEWFEKVVEVKEMKGHVRSFLNQLQLFLFSNTEKSLRGLSSITGQFIFIYDKLDFFTVIDDMQHEIVHSFFRFYRLKTSHAKWGKDISLNLLFRSIRYGEYPIHSATLYDYIFSGCEIEPRDISPFSLNYERKAMK